MLGSALLILAAGLTYLLFERQLQRETDRLLSLRAAASESLVDRSASPPTLRVADPGGELARGESVLRLYRATGELLADGSPAAPPSAAEADLVRSAAARGADASGRAAEPGGEQQVLLARPLAADPGLVLVVGIEASRLDEPLAALRLAFAAAIPAAALALALGAYLIGRQALAPVGAMVAAARRIDPESGGQQPHRLPVPAADDEIRALAETLNEMLGRLAAASERERDFIARAAHDLRTPIAGILATADVALRGDRPAAEYREALATVRERAAALTHLANRLIDLNRLQHGEVRPEPVNPGALLREVAARWITDGHPAERLHLDVDPSAEVHVALDPVALERAVRNLLENVDRHAGPGASAWVSAVRADGVLRITVADDGPGLPAPPDELVRPFASAGGPASPGDGLGLAIVASAARAHGGTLRAIPRGPRGGACFVIELPAPGSA